MRIQMLAAIAAVVFVAAPAQAVVTFTFAQVGNDVVLTSSGSLNLIGAASGGFYGVDGFVNPTAGSLAVGTSALVFGYRLTSPAVTFGTGGFVNGTPDLGSAVGLQASALGTGFVYVPELYVSGSALIGSTTFESSTFASLGLTAGTYNFSIPNDTIRLIVPGAVTGAVPESSTWAMMLLGFGGIGFAVRRNRRNMTAQLA